MVNVKMTKRFHNLCDVGNQNKHLCTNPFGDINYSVSYGESSAGSVKLYNVRHGDAQIFICLHKRAQTRHKPVQPFSINFGTDGVLGDLRLI